MNSLVESSDPLGCARQLVVFGDGCHPWAQMTAGAAEQSATVLLLRSHLVECLGEVYVPLAKPLTLFQRLRSVAVDCRHHLRWRGLDVRDRLGPHSLEVHLLSALAAKNALPASWLSEDGSYRVKPDYPQLSPEFVRLTDAGREFRDAFMQEASHVPADLIAFFVERVRQRCDIEVELIVPQILDQVRSAAVPPVHQFNTQINFNGYGFTEEDRATIRDTNEQVKSQKAKTERKAAPKKRSRKNMSTADANEILMGFLRADPATYAGMNERELAEAVGCSRPTLRNTDAYQNIETVREELRRS